MKIMNFQKHLKKIIFLKIYQNFEITFDRGLVEQIDKRLHFQAGFFMHFNRKIRTAFLVMNERITSKNEPLKLYKGQHLFGFPLARGAPVLLLRATGVSS